MRRHCLPGKWGSAQSNAGRGGPSLAPACGDPKPVSGGGRRPADARGAGGVGGGGEAGRRKPTTKLASPSARLDLNGRSPRQRSAAETRESAVGRRGAARRGGAAGTGLGRPGGPRAGAELGSGLGLPAWCDGSSSWPGGAAHLAPSVGALHGGRSRRPLTRGRDPQRFPPRRGLFSPARGWSQPRPLLLRTSGKNLRADGVGGGVEGRGQATGNVGGRWNQGVSRTPVLRAWALSMPMFFHVSSSQVAHPSTSLQTEKLRPIGGQRSAPRTHGQPVRPPPDLLLAWLPGPAPRNH